MALSIYILDFCILSCKSLYKNPRFEMVNHLTYTQVLQLVQAASAKPLKVRE